MAAIPTILKGDDSGAISITMATGRTYTGATLVVAYQGVTRSFTNLTPGQTISLTFTHQETANFSLKTAPILMRLIGQYGAEETVENAEARIRVTDCLAEVNAGGSFVVEPGGTIVDPTKVPITDVGDMAARYSLADIKAKVDQIVRVLAQRSLLAFGGVALLAWSASGALDVQTAQLDELYNDSLIVTNISGSSGITADEAGTIATNTVNDKVASWAMNGQPQPTTDLSPAINYTTAVSNKLETAIDAKATSNDLASVAWSGAYGDLSGRPTIPEVPSGIVTTNESGAVEGLKLWESEGNGTASINDGYFTTSAYDIDIVKLPLYAAMTASFSCDISANSFIGSSWNDFKSGADGLGDYLASNYATPANITSLSNHVTASYVVKEFSKYSAPNGSAKLNCYAGSENFTAWEFAIADHPALKIGVNDWGEWGELQNGVVEVVGHFKVNGVEIDDKIKNVSAPIATNAATAVFAECADYILTNAATSAAFTIRSGEIAQTAISGTSLDLTLDFSTAANCSGDCLVYAVCAQDATLAILPSASVSPLGSDWTALKAGTNIVCVTRLAYDGAKSVVAVAVKEVK